MGHDALAESIGKPVSPMLTLATAASESAFWRLLGDYERTCEDETVALHAEDFQVAETIQILKATLLAALQEGGRVLGIDRSHPAFHERLEAIASGERANEVFVQGLLARNVAEQKSLHTALARLRGLQHSYVSARPAGSGSFFARG